MQLNQSLKQQLTMSPALIQQINLVQMSALELTEHIQTQVLENPFLQLHEQTYNQAYSESFLHNIPSEVSTLEQDLLEQLPLQHALNAFDLSIFIYLIRCLDERLFLTTTAQEAAQQFNTTAAHVEVLIDFLQSLQPVGIGARNAEEFLLLQIYADDAAPRYAASFIAEQIEHVSKHNIKALSRIFHISIAEVKTTLAYIKGLKHTIYHERTARIAPYVKEDVRFYKMGDQWLIEIVDTHYPKVSLNEDYIALLKDEKEFATYYKEHLQAAVQLLHGIDFRKQTLYSICHYIMQEQLPFLERGINYLKPMRLIDVADAIAVHESTVSRTIREKYIRTPHGIMPIKTLFSGGMYNTSGKMDSTLFIKNKLKAYIAAEQRHKPLSDTQLMKQLQAEGIQISRRTVAKYREELGIASSFVRGIQE